jgi:serine/threonine protein kinase
MEFIGKYQNDLSLNIWKKPINKKIKSINKNKNSLVFDTFGYRYTTDTKNEILPFYRKNIQIYPDRPNNELQIYTILSHCSHPNIVTAYKIWTDYIDLERLDISFKITPKIIDTMRHVKTFLQQKGIIYLDWKPDNIGLDSQGIPKLFDFDAAGICYTDSYKWMYEPPMFYRYRLALETGLTNPVQIDDYCFDKYISG